MPSLEDSIRACQFFGGKARARKKATGLPNIAASKSQRSGSLVIDSAVLVNPSVKGKKANMQRKNAAAARAMLRETDGTGTEYINFGTDSAELCIFNYSQFGM
jgi:hypothetical protein